MRFQRSVLIHIRCAAFEAVSNFNRYQKKLHWKMTWKLFAVIFTFALVMAYAAAEIPSYIHVCVRNNPNIDKCIMNSIDDLKIKICKGIPELGSPPIEPFTIDTLVISDTDNAKLYLRDIELKGLCDFTLSSFQSDIDKLRFDFTLLFKRIHANGTYDFDVRVLVPIVQKGPVNLMFDDVEAIARLYMTLLTKGDQTYVYISKLNLELNIKGLKSKFEANKRGSSQLNEILSTFVGSNEQELIARVKQPIETKVSKRMISISNNIVKHFTFDELFPKGG